MNGFYGNYKSPVKKLSKNLQERVEKLEKEKKMKEMRQEYKEDRDIAEKQYNEETIQRNIKEFRNNWMM